MRSLRPGGCVGLLALLAGCGAGAGPSSPPEEPLVRGVVESIAHRATASGIVVRALPGSREMCGISATVDHATRILRRAPSGETTIAALAAIDVGDTVAVYVTGAVAESCPVQGRAGLLVVEE